MKIFECTVHKAKMKIDGDTRTIRVGPNGAVCALLLAKNPQAGTIYFTDENGQKTRRFCTVEEVQDW